MFPDSVPICAGESAVIFSSKADGAEMLTRTASVDILTSEDTLT